MAWFFIVMLIIANTLVLSIRLIKLRSWFIGLLGVVVLFLQTTCMANDDKTASLGTGLQFALPLVALSLSWYKGDTTGIKQFSYATLLAEGVTYILKPTINERRPDGGSWSFPSGHTMISFDASTYLWRRYGAQYGVPATVLAAFVGYSRIEAKRHYFHDVLAGAALGIAANLIFTSKYQVAVSTVPSGGADVAISRTI